MKKYLLLAAAGLTAAACADKGLENNHQNGELEESYVAISFAADDMNTKAGTDPDGVYELGRDEERAVKSAYVFFFKDGAAFPVAFDGTTSTNAGPINYLEVDLDGTQSGMNNISDVKNAVLVLQNYKGEYPDQLLAVINWTPENNKSYTLENLRAKISTLGNDTDGYVMTNAVYADKANQKIDAFDLTLANIGKTKEDALANPVTIHVERVAAKVVFTAKNNGKFAIEKEIEGKPIYAQIKGFELYNDYQESWLIKRIDPTKWTDLGFNWNDSDWHRSYWAQSLGKAFDNNTFAWTTDNTPINGYVYCGENTRTWTEEADVRTKVVVKAQLVDADDNPVEVVNWYGKDYIDEADLLTVVANTLKNTYYSSADGSTFIGIKPEDLKCVDRLVTDAKAYEVYFQLSDTGKGKTWYKYEGGNYSALEDAAFNTVLAAVQPALVYNDGMTYYWTDIKHLGAPGKTGEFGVVRNHIYKVNITDITGYGTPVYDGTSDFINLEKPTDIVTYVAAQVNILSWRLVAHDYELK